jgi:hypothetical protein
LPSVFTLTVPKVFKRTSCSEKKFIRDLAGETLQQIAKVCHGKVLLEMLKIATVAHETKNADFSQCAQIVEFCLARSTVGRVADENIDTIESQLGCAVQPVLKGLAELLGSRLNAEGKAAARKSCRRLCKALGQAEFNRFAEEELEGASGSLVKTNAAAESSAAAVKKPLSMRERIEQQRREQKQQQQQQQQ